MDDEDIQKTICKALNDIAKGAYKYMGDFIPQLFDLGTCYFNAGNEEVIKTYLEIWTTLSEREIEMDNAGTSEKIIFNNAETIFQILQAAFQFDSKNTDTDCVPNDEITVSVQAGITIEHVCRIC